VTSLEDLEGLKIRVPQNKIMLATYQAWGASPISMSWPEVFTGLQQGVIDGQDNPDIVNYTMKFQEVQKYLSITGHVYTPAYILASQKSFSKLPEDVQAMLTDCGNKTQDFTYEKAAQLETELLEVIKAAGVEVNEADKAAFIEASKPIYEAFAKEVDGGQEMIDQVLGLAKGN